MAVIDRERMIATARAVADFAYKQGVSDAAAIDDLIAEVEHKEKRIQELEASLAQASDDASRLRELVNRAVYPVTAALNSPAHPWHGFDEARRWLMDAASDKDR